MPSLRQPVGPLPASIYWRRRIVVLVALAIVLALAFWMFAGSGGDGKSGKQGGAQPAPVQSITPGASPTGPAVDSRPGGSGGSGSSGGSTGSGGVSGSGGGEVSLTAGGGTGSASGGSNGGSSGTGGSGGTAGGGAAGGTGGAGNPLPVNTAEVMALPVCSAGQLSLELAGSQDAYKAKEKPRLSLTVRNTSTGACRVNLGRLASTVTVTLAESNERVWSSGDCPTDRQDTWVQLGAGTGLTETFTWERGRSKQQCATPDATPAPLGRYLVQAALTGPAGGPVSARALIRLDN
ncbi:hypothetical protein ACIA8O_34700 [Kitasatospora sp. NPDC051853]|uniref:hypothetical protein n=1 Tax=Kitasatospora sp. NPDC051853 TaxID=3364058 RepID=UPI00379C26E9